MAPQDIAWPDQRIAAASLLERAQIEEEENDLVSAAATLQAAADRLARLGDTGCAPWPTASTSDPVSTRHRRRNSTNFGTPAATPKFKSVLQPHRVGAMVNNLQRALVLDRLPTDIEADDPFDAFFLAMAIAGEADYLVTGDHRAGLLQREHVDRTRIVTPTAFCAEAL